MSIKQLENWERLWLVIGLLAISTGVFVLLGWGGTLILIGLLACLVASSFREDRLAQQAPKIQAEKTPWPAEEN